MKIAIVGGHFSPAMALIQVIPKSDNVIFLGRKHAFEGDDTLSFEYLICDKNNIPFFDIPATRFQRKLARFTFRSLLKSPQGVSFAKNVLQKEKPDVLVSFGGYLSIPVAIAARMLSIPVVIHEQTQKAGLANRIIGKLIADRVCVTFESSKVYFPQKKVEVVGLPLRQEIFEDGKPVVKLSKGDRLLYITGGSTGSHFINDLVSQNLITLLSDFVIVHQTGDSSEYADFDKLSEFRNGLASDLQKKYTIKKFVDTNEIGWILQNANVVISRSGINTVAELLELGIPGLLFPLPYGQRYEQLENAKLFVSRGLGEYLLQKDVTNENFLESLDRVSKIKRTGIKGKQENPAQALLAIIQRYEKKPTPEIKTD